MGTLIVALQLAGSFVGLSRATAQATSSIPIQHFIFVIQENHSFDNYFGTFPGANGLPQGIALPDYPGGPLIERPFLGGPTSHDLNHSWVAAQLAYDNGAMDGFFWAEWKAAMNFYGTSLLKLVEKAFGLGSLTARDGAANTMLECFDFSQTAFTPLVRW